MPSSDPPPLSEQEVFQVAAELPPNERDSYLRAACEGRPAVRAAVDQLLASIGDEAFMKRAADRTASPEMDAELVRLKPEEAGERIGNYKLLEQIGEGGFGVVWVAEQEKPVRRRVALKIIKLGMDTKEVIARFEQERQALAMMDHPNIAKVLDAGATPFGRPFFAMELVRGIKITEYCDQANLPTEERLQLFIAVCHAVQHAHQKGIIHRDLKPSNILVTLHDGVPVPKVIDFGVAKATQQQRLTDLTVYTQFEQMIGTPLYMSPEQAEMSGLDIDTRSDIYSLGVLLYELLVGRTPFDPEELMKAGYDEMRRVIREQEPQKPSTFLSTMALELRTASARRRQTDGAKWIGQIRGDLDWIVMKALEKDRTRRYETASGFARDIERHLVSEPVQARPPTPLYRFRRMVRRNKVAFGAATAVLMALVVGFVVSTWMFLQEKRARERAVAAEKLEHQQRQKAEQVALFLKKMLSGVGPSVALGRDTTMLREILDQTAQQIGKDLKDQPEVEADLRSVIGDVYQSLGDFPKAEAMFDEALALQAKHLAVEHPDLAVTLANLGLAQTDRGKFDEAEANLRKALAMQWKLLRKECPEIAETMTRLAYSLRRRGQLIEAETTAREAVAMNRKLLGNEHESVADSLVILSQAIGHQGRGAESQEINREILAISRKVYGEGHPRTAAALASVGKAARGEGKLEESEIATREALAIQRKVYGAGHLQIVESLSNLAGVLKGQGKQDEAEAAAREAVEMSVKVAGIGYSWSVTCLGELADLLTRNRKLVEAESVVREHLEMARQQLGDENPVVASLLGQLAGVMLQGRRLTEAETLAREAVQMRAKEGSSKYGATDSLTVLSRVLEAQGRRAEAEALQREALAIARSSKNAWRVERQLWIYGENLYRSGKYAEAEPLYREYLESRRSRRADEHEAVARLAHFLGEWAWAERTQITPPDSDESKKAAANGQTPNSRAREAERLLREVLHTRMRVLDPDDRRIAESRSHLGGAVAVVAFTDRDLAPETRAARFAEAEGLLLNAPEALKSNAQVGREDQRDALTWIVRLYEEWSKPGEAAKWRQQLADFDQAKAEKLNSQSASPQVAK